ncbi:IS66 family insertion sequence element accessory protein TnpA [Teredinibacter purpureus]|uniref:IS66 family insertion sequence element accessory protein TnpA n=1 Tax=Teredinibacter purpureus TaxID=2731756 RepID=UPI0005F82FAA|nr:hypothetical protein [Teredinibacter purpureus]
MRKYKKYDWPKLIEAFKQSGQTQTQYCKDQKINSSYFNQQLNKRLSRNQSKFVAVGVESTKIGTVDTNFTIAVGRCKIQCPANMPMQSLLTLVHSLA